MQSDKYYKNCVMFKKPINVSLPDSKKLKAKKVGNIVINFKNYYDTQAVDLKKCLFR